MNTRIGNIASLPFGADRSGSLRKVVIAGLIVAGLMIYVGGKVQIMRLGYQINSLEKQKSDLERSNRALQIEASSLASPVRIEEIATKYGVSCRGPIPLQTTKLRVRTLKTPCGVGTGHGNATWDRWEMRRHCSQPHLCRRPQKRL